MESSVLNFRNNLKALTFKTFYRNQTQQFDYDDLFADRRVLVFSIPTILGTRSMKHLQAFHTNYQQLIASGIDDIYTISSGDLLIAPWTEKHSGIIKGLPDATKNFLSALSEHYQINKPLDKLSSYWQYITIINNGTPEKLWHNPIKADMTLSVFKHTSYAYHGLTVEKVQKYLVDQ